MVWAGDSGGWLVPPAKWHHPSSQRCFKPELSLHSSLRKQLDEASEAREGLCVGKAQSTGYSYFEDTSWSNGGQEELWTSEPWQGSRGSMESRAVWRSKEPWGEEGVASRSPDHEEEGAQKELWPKKQSADAPAPGSFWQDQRTWECTLCIPFNTCSHPQPPAFPTPLFSRLHVCPSQQRCEHSSPLNTCECSASCTSIEMQIRTLKKLLKNFSNHQNCS